MKSIFQTFKRLFFNYQVIVPSALRSLPIHINQWLQVLKKDVSWESDSPNKCLSFIFFGRWSKLWEKHSVTLSILYYLKKQTTLPFESWNHLFDHLWALGSTTVSAASVKLKMPRFSFTSRNGAVLSWKCRTNPGTEGCKLRKFCKFRFCQLFN